MITSTICEIRASSNVEWSGQVFSNFFRKDFELRFNSFYIEFIYSEECRMFLMKFDDKLKENIREKNIHVVEDRGEGVYFYDGIRKAVSVIIAFNLDESLFFFSNRQKEKICYGFLFVCSDILIIQNRSVVRILKNEISVDDWKEASDNEEMDELLKEVFYKNKFFGWEEI